MATLRELRTEDADSALALWQLSTADGHPPVFGVADAITAIADPACAAQAAVDEDGKIIGTVVVRLEGPRAWLVRWVVHPDHRGGGVGSELLDAAVDAARVAGADRLSALLPGGEVGREAFRARGFHDRSDLMLFDRTLGPRETDQGLAATLVEESAWADLAGMQREKQLIERRIVLPHTDARAAADHGLQPPRAVILFGPPGTGKTTFARAVAGRLGWPFVELRPSALLDSDGAGSGPAARLRSFFTAVRDLPSVVLFIDEVEEIAGRRGARDERHTITNELLKVIPPFRKDPDRLLICATNAIDDLDPALTRPGRFDYLLGIGPPDVEARHAIWSAYLSAAKGADKVDIDRLAQASDGATPADIQFAANKGLQQAFERAVLDGDDRGVDTTDLIRAWEAVGPSLSRDDLRRFEDELDQHQRD